jgi:hypothetical protein
MRYWLSLVGDDLDMIQVLLAEEDGEFLFHAGALGPILDKNRIDQLNGGGEFFFRGGVDVIHRVGSFLPSNISDFIISAFAINIRRSGKIAQ